MAQREYEHLLRYSRETKSRYEKQLRNGQVVKTGNLEIPNRNSLDFQRQLTAKLDTICNGLVSDEERASSLVFLHAAIGLFLYREPGSKLKKLELLSSGPYREYLWRLVKCVRNNTGAEISKRIVFNFVIPVLLPEERLVENITKYLQQVWELVCAMFGCIPEWQLEYVPELISGLYNLIIDNIPKDPEELLTNVAEWSSRDDEFLLEWIFRLTYIATQNDAHIPERIQNIASKLLPKHLGMTKETKFESAQRWIFHLVWILILHVHPDMRDRDLEISNAAIEALNNNPFNDQAYLVFFNNNADAVLRLVKGFRSVFVQYQNGHANPNIGSLVKILSRFLAKFNIFFKGKLLFSILLTQKTLATEAPFRHEPELALTLYDSTLGATKALGCAQAIPFLVDVFKNSGDRNIIQRSSINIQKIVNMVLDLEMNPLNEKYLNMLISVLRTDNFRTLAEGDQKNYRQLILSFVQKYPNMPGMQVIVFQFATAIEQSDHRTLEALKRLEIWNEVQYTRFRNYRNERVSMTMAFLASGKTRMGPNLKVADEIMAKIMYRAGYRSNEKVKRQKTNGDPEL